MLIDRSFPMLAFASLLVVVLAGCEQEDVRIYTAPGDTSSAQTPPQQSGPATAQQSGELAWTAPETWQRMPGEQPMRLATYLAGDGEQPLQVAVSAFPGNLGGPLPNINRWREQLDLPPLDESQWPDHVDPFGEADASVRGWTMRIDGDGRGMLAAIIQTEAAERTWFVRADGSPAQLDAHEADVVSFANSFHLPEGAATTPTDAPYGAPAPDRVTPPSSEQPTSAVSEAGGRELAFNTPANWHREQRGSSIVYASFHTHSQTTDEQAMVAITPLRGEGGGLLMNVNMWRNQLGLPAIDDVSEQPTESLEVDGREATQVSLDSEQHDASLIVIIVPEGDRTWFFRMVGPRAAVHDQRDVFEQFVTATRFTGSE